MQALNMPVRIQPGMHQPDNVEPCDIALQCLGKHLLQVFSP